MALTPNDTGNSVPKMRYKVKLVLCLMNLHVLKTYDAIEIWIHQFYFGISWRCELHDPAVLTLWIEQSIQMGCSET
jgi:hypothetical protein